MSQLADDKKRWAILPPPSRESTEASDDFDLEIETAAWRIPASRRVREAGEERDEPSDSSIEALEPSDSARATDPGGIPASGRRRGAQEALCWESGFTGAADLLTEAAPADTPSESGPATIPAPAWFEEDEELG